ncbi:peptidase M10 [Haloferula helveola]|uniref:Peptidase M10 n=2 Tax=Haloferula helveola TaxID=490095 RepID=A0ABN6H427_9BACT|nr:peptidase M10 [Haloferula helveola]
MGSSAVPAFGLEGILRPDFEIIPRSPFETLSAEFPDSSLSDPPVAFSITVNYSGDAAFESAFEDAAAIWESIIPYYVDGNQGAAQFSGVVINASVVSIDGSGGILGSAGPSTGGYDDSGYLLATTGTMQFDADDFSSPTGSFEAVVLHEMAHVLGIGTLWSFNGLYDASDPSVIDPNNGQTVGQYNGAFGLLGWQAEFDSDATYVPVEKGGGSGTANGHWNEGDGGAPTGYTSSITGQDSRFELMTGWLNGGSYIGEVTKGSLRDLGYEVTVVPEPTVWLTGSLLGMGLLLRRRRHGFRAR